MAKFICVVISAFHNSPVSSIFRYSCPVMILLANEQVFPRMICACIEFIFGSVTCSKSLYPNSTAFCGNSPHTQYMWLKIILTCVLRHHIIFKDKNTSKRNDSSNKSETQKHEWSERMINPLFLRFLYP